ncbi:MAG: type transport system permease protein [Nocardioidaceae bacterium]|jgi:ABC-2 type transport system permease protein|nr:type transport system permease protein [Nocardioidaceae bacterium]MDX6309863.1 type transport system permease protein [Nocardioidaceae bacterium]
MSIITAPLQPAAPVEAEQISRVPLLRLLHVELRKVTDTRAGKWLFIGIGAITAVVILVFLLVGAPTDLTFNNFLTATGSPQGYLLPVLGVLAITSEWSQRTGLVTFTLEPSRVRVVAAKFIAMILLGLTAVAVAFALAAGGNVLGIVTQSGTGAWHYTAAWVAEVGLGQIIGIIEGLAFGMLFMNSAAAIVTFFVAPIAWSALFGLVSWLQGAAPWVDLNSASSPLFNHDMTGQAWLHLGVAVSLWVVAPLLIGVARLMRSEVK